MMIALWQKYKAQILYLFFGGCTTAVNVAVYFICTGIFRIPNIPSTVLSWILAVLFAFITNKVFVFESKSFARAVLLPELVSFFAARIVTGILDVGMMALTVDVLHRNAYIWKLISNLLVILLNYLASKWFIFKKKGS